MQEKPQQTKSVLILTGSGGGGLIQAAKAKEQQMYEEYPHAKVLTKDVMLDWLGSFGRFGVGSWNRAQRKGDVNSQQTLGNLQIIGDVLFWPAIFFHTFVTLWKEDIDRVIDTLPIGTSAVVRAIRFFNRIKKKEIVLEKVLVDLPTKKSTHFFQGVKKLSKKDRDCVRLVTIEPLLEEEKTPDEFWQKHCGISEKMVHYENLVIRKGFKPYVGKKREEKEHHIVIRFDHSKEAELIQRAFFRGRPKVERNEDHYQFLITPNDKLFVVLLGSQPSIEGTCGYVRSFIEVMKKHSDEKKNYYLFVFCSKFADSRRSLFHRVLDIIEKEGKYPSNLTIVPMSFQESDSVGSLFFRSDVAITRSGGQTMMELMGVSNGETWVHSEAKNAKNGNFPTYEQLIKGIPSWEAGNAIYLERKCGGKIVTPSTIIELLASQL